MLKEKIVAAADLSMRVADVLHKETDIRVRILAQCMLLGGDAGINGLPLQVVLDAVIDCFNDAANFSEAEHGIKH